MGYPRKFAPHECPECGRLHWGAKLACWRCAGRRTSKAVRSITVPNAMRLALLRDAARQARIVLYAERAERQQGLFGGESDGLSTDT